MEFMAFYKAYMPLIPRVINQIMPFRRNRGNFLRPVNRIKHVVDQQFGLALNTVLPLIIAETSDTPDLANSDEVETGSVIRSFFCSLEIVNTGTAGVLANCYAMFAKNPGGNLTLPNPNVVGISDNKRYVFHQEMIMLQMQDNSNPRTLFKGVLKVPRHLQRMGPNDILTCNILAPGVEVNGCVQFHYKELR